MYLDIFNFLKKKLSQELLINIIFLKKKCKTIIH